MADHQFEDPTIAALYDEFCPWDRRDDFHFYLPRILASRAALDVGCGTGLLLHRAREAGHEGRLVGIDPAHGMLEQARKRTDVEWVHGDLTRAGFEREFDFIVMTGHAFQVLLGDDELRAFLGAIRTALAEGGRFAFETRNPLDRAWERWNVEYAIGVRDASGAEVQMKTEVHRVEGEFVEFGHTYSCERWAAPQRSDSKLRFLSREALLRFLEESGLRVHEEYGDFTGGAFTDQSEELVLVVGAA